VLVVAKMPIALSCFEDKVRRMTTVAQNGAGDGTPALACLTTAGFLRRGGNTFRSSADPAQCVTSEPRLAMWRRRRAMECFWVDSQPSPTASSSSLPVDECLNECCEDVRELGEVEVHGDDLDSSDHNLACDGEVDSAHSNLPQTPRLPSSASSLISTTAKNKEHANDSASPLPIPPECRIRGMLRSGEWKLLEPQPNVCLKAIVQPHAKLSPGAAAAHKWLPCAYLVRTGSASSASSAAAAASSGTVESVGAAAVDALGTVTPAKGRATAGDGPDASIGSVPLARKATFVCGLCGADNATEAPFLKHLERHCDGRLWETGVYDARVLRSRRPGYDHTSTTSLTGACAEGVEEEEVFAGEWSGTSADKASSSTVENVSARHLSAWLGAQAAERETAADIKAALLDEQLQALESRIRQAWALLRAPAVRKDKTSSSSCVVSQGQSLLAVVASAVHGAHAWEKHEKGAHKQLHKVSLPEPQQEEKDEQQNEHSQHSAEGNKASSQFFADMCAPVADCPHCFARHGPMIAETLRLLTAASPSDSSSSSGSNSTDAASGPSHATAATLLLRLQRDLRLTAGTAPAPNMDLGHGGNLTGSVEVFGSINEATTGACGCADKLVAVLVSTLPRQDNDDSSDDASSDDGFSQRQVLTARCRQALLALEVN